MALILEVPSPPSLQEMVTAGEACGKVLFCICGTYGSLCCLLLSVWGTLMLVSGCCTGTAIMIIYRGDFGHRRLG